MYAKFDFGDAHTFPDDLAHKIKEEEEKDKIEKNVHEVLAEFEKNDYIVQIDDAKLLILYNKFTNTTITFHKIYKYYYHSDSSAIDMTEHKLIDRLVKALRWVRV